MIERLAVYAAALWWGSLSVIGFMAVPLMFAHIPTKFQAGQVAAQLFSAQAWVSVACGVVLLLVLRQRVRVDTVGRNHTTIIWVVLGLLLALLLQYGVAPKIIARHDLRMWHSIGTGLYAMQWLCAGALLWRVSGPQRSG